uniref:Zinc finger, CCHC-type n=1 Tax=Steinernema glaseri TaxID=37863 RepID=A0A1I7Y146_9BILA
MAILNDSSQTNPTTMFHFDNCKNCYAKDHDIEHCPYLEKIEDSTAPPAPRERQPQPTPSPEQKATHSLSRQQDSRIPRNQPDGASRSSTPGGHRLRHSASPNLAQQVRGHAVVDMPNTSSREESPAQPRPRRGPRTPPGTPPEMEDWELEMQQVLERCCDPKKEAGTPCTEHFFLEMDEDAEQRERDVGRSNEGSHTDSNRTSVHVEDLQQDQDLEEGELVDTDTPEDAVPRRRSPTSPVRRRDEHRRHRRSRIRSPQPEESRETRQSSSVRHSNDRRHRSHRRPERRSASRSRSRSKYRSRSPQRTSSRRSPHRIHRSDHDSQDRRRSRDRDTRHHHHQSSSFRSGGYRDERSSGYRDERGHARSIHRQEQRRNYNRAPSESEHRSQASPIMPNSTLPTIGNIGSFPANGLLDSNAIMSVAMALTQMHQPQNLLDNFNVPPSSHSRSEYRDARRDGDRRHRPPSRFGHRGEGKDSYHSRNSYQKYN